MTGIVRANTRSVILLAALAGAVVLFALDSGEIGTATGPTSPVAATSGAGSAAAVRRQGAILAGGTGRLEIPARPVFGEQRGEIFGAHAWQPAAPGPQVAAPPPVAPPMPYKFSGAFVYEGRLQVFLAKGDAIIPVALGETIEGGYRVEAIDERQVTLTYLPLEQKQIIPISTSLSFAGARLPTSGDRAASRAGAASDRVVGDGLVLVLDGRHQNKSAQFLWQGPQQVKLGTPFTVALRVTSAQPVLASPMQISLNPALLEVVAVKPGRFFDNDARNFSYRLNPGGSIFVGASSPQPAPVADAELVVLTLKPLKPAPAAELAITSLSLLGPAGRVISFDSPAAFRTAITN